MTVITTLSPIKTSTPIQRDSQAARYQVSSSAVAVSPDGSIVAAVNPDSDSVTLVDATTLTVLQEITVGDDPRTIAFTPDSRLLLVANRGSASVSIVPVDEAGDISHVAVGLMPYGVVTDGKRVFVAEFALGNIGLIELSTGKAVRRLPVDPFPAGLAISSEGRSDGRPSGRLLVTHFFTGQVTAIDLESLSVSAEVSTGADTNLSQFIAVEPGGKKAYLPQTRSNVSNAALTFDTTVFLVVNVLDLTDFSLSVRERITIDTADEAVNIPIAVALSPDGSRLFVANAGSDDVSVVDLSPNPPKDGLGDSP